MAQWRHYVWEVKRLDWVEVGTIVTRLLDNEAAHR